MTQHATKEFNKAVNLNKTNHLEDDIVVKRLETDSGD
ncbi:MAG: hypothetical protein RL007_262 [Bacteroidota bacterium]|jgi:hypothetical protein